MDFRRFAVEVSTFSNGILEAKERCYTHWQIWHNGKCLVDVWPTTNKYRESNLKSGAAARKGDPYAAINRALELFYSMSKSPPLEIRHPAGSVEIKLSQEYLKELAEKVEHGFNLLNEEARHLFAHAGILIPKHKRCERCNNDGTIKVTIPGTTTFETQVCPICRGRRGPVAQPQPQRELSWSYDYEGRWKASSADKDPQGIDRIWRIDATSTGTFWIGESDFIIDEDSLDFPTLQQAKDFCQKQEKEIDGASTVDLRSPASKEMLLASAYELLRCATTESMGGTPEGFSPALPRGLQFPTEHSNWQTWDRLVKQLLVEIDEVC